MHDSRAPPDRSVCASLLGLLVCRRFSQWLAARWLHKLLCDFAFVHPVSSSASVALALPCRLAAILMRSFCRVFLQRNRIKTERILQQRIDSHSPNEHAGKGNFSAGNGSYIGGYFEDRVITRSFCKPRAVRQILTICKQHLTVF